MSIRDSKQELAPSCNEMIASIETFNRAVLERSLEVGEPWRADHLQEINDLSDDLIRLRCRLIKVSKETWQLGIIWLSVNLLTMNDLIVRYHGRHWDWLTLADYVTVYVVDGLAIMRKLT